MLYICCAFYAEADIFIHHYELKKIDTGIKFPVFTDENQSVMLMLTGVGEIAAAAAVASVFTQFPPAQEDILINIGTCAAKADVEGFVMVNKIVEAVTGRTFYPDMQFCHPFCEATVKTEAVVQTEVAVQTEAEVQTEIDGALVVHDMEAAAIYQAANYYMGPHQMVFVKLISDHGQKESHLSPAMIKQMFEDRQEEIFSFVDRIKTIDRLPKHNHQCQEGNEKQEDSQWQNLVEQLAEDLHCSHTMRKQLEQLVYYLSLEQSDYRSVIKQYYANEQLPCKDKKEGKKRFEQLRRELL